MEVTKNWSWCQGEWRSGRGREKRFVFGLDSFTWGDAGIGRREPDGYFSVRLIYALYVDLRTSVDSGPEVDLFMPCSSSTLLAFPWYRVCTTLLPLWCLLWYWRHMWPRMSSPTICTPNHLKCKGTERIIHNSITAALRILLENKKLSGMRLSSIQLNNHYCILHQSSSVKTIHHRQSGRYRPLRNTAST